MSAFIPLLKKYSGWTTVVIVLGVVSNVLSLYVPKVSAQVIDHISIGTYNQSLLVLVYITFGALFVTIAQILASTYFSEKVGLDIRHQLIEKISNQTYTYISDSTPGRLLTIMTSDITAMQAVISQGLVTLFGAIITLVGAGILLISINAHLALITLSVIPFLILTFIFVFGTLSKLFLAGQENLEKVNSVINESIIGAALVRVLNATFEEVKKFTTVNSESRSIGLGTVRNISALIPIITLLSNASIMIIIWFGGIQVVQGGLTIGNFSAFLSYAAMFVWPLFVLSFVGTYISRGGVSLERINAVLNAPIKKEEGTYDGPIKGKIEFRNVGLIFIDKDGNERTVLKDISFVIQPQTRNAIVGPTAAGKTQLFYLMCGLIPPSSGEILIDDRPLSSYKTESLFSHIGLVFQDSIMFNTTFRENVAFSESTSNEVLDKALRTAELQDLVKSLPQGLDTMVSERGTSLSGGQKQRLMLARALAIDPQILLLDDFTARVDQATEATILSNVATNYPDVTLISITQKVEPIKSYDNIIVLMEGELVALGRHQQLLETSLEYKQIFESQQSTETLHA